MSILYTNTTQVFDRKGIKRTLLIGINELTRTDRFSLFRLRGSTGSKQQLLMTTSKSFTSSSITFIIKQRSSSITFHHQSKFIIKHIFITNKNFIINQILSSIIKSSSKVLLKRGNEDPTYM